MARLRWGVVAVVASALGCQPATTNPPSLFISARPTSIPNDGTTTTLNISATDAKGNGGTGSVTLSAPSGVLGGASVTLDATGSATTTFACGGCTAGLVKITGTWTPAGTATVNVTVTAPGADAGSGDGGNGSDGGSDGGTIGFGNGTKLALSASRVPIFYGVGDHSDITALLTFTDGGPIGNQPLAFSTNLGGFIPLVGPPGTPMPTASATTAADGTAVVRFTDTGTPGTATITANHAASNATATLPLAISTVQQITWTQTLCGPNPCTIMGVKGSGNEQAHVLFKVVDPTSLPVPGITVTFTLSNGAPSGTSVTPSAVTDATGVATAIVSSGATRGVVTVHAVVIAGRVEANSTPIGITGTKVANKGFTLQCSPANIDALASNQPPLNVASVCSFKVEDRFLNPVGTGQTISFNAEAGGIPSTGSAQAFNPNNPTDPLEGTGTVTFNAQGAFPPLDVPPLASDPTQFPFARAPEPSVVAGALVRNPRDGLVSVLAFTTGEEWFDDANQNGQWDPGETFIDQGEPFVDSNDNGVWDPGELFIDLGLPDGGAGNGVWDPPNGVWDGNTTIWTEARILYTGIPLANPAYSSVSPNPFAGTCPAGTQLTGGAKATLFATFADENLNVPWAQGTTFGGAYTGNGTFLFTAQTLVDTYGFQIERRLLTNTHTADCQPGVTPICHWKIQFYGWSGGYTNPPATITSPLPVIGPDGGNQNPCGVGVATFQSTVAGVITTVTSQGSVQ
jgi:hypothetical protein